MYTSEVKEIRKLTAKLTAYVDRLEKTDHHEIIRKLELRVVNENARYLAAQNKVRDLKNKVLWHHEQFTRMENLYLAEKAKNEKAQSQEASADRMPSDQSDSGDKA